MRFGSGSYLWRSVSVDLWQYYCVSYSKSADRKEGMDYYV